MKRLLLASLLGSAIALATSANAAQTDLKALEEAARAEGEVNSVGMPDSWANWKDTWQDLEKMYGLKHMDTDMSSAQEIAKFAAEKDNATADIGDVGRGLRADRRAARCYPSLQAEHLGTDSLSLGQGHRRSLDAGLHRLHRLYRQQATGQGHPDLLGRAEGWHLQSRHRRCQRRCTSG
jgi:hypothetical protein